MNKEIQSFINNILIEAGEVIMGYFGKNPKIYTKGENANDFATEADIKSQKIMVDAIKEKYPGHGLVGEELVSENTGSEYVWHIDPLDGTRNFNTRVPLFGINIALVQSGIVKHAAIYLPSTEEFFYAEAGFGSFLNGEKIKCSEISDWSLTYGIGPIKSRGGKFFKALSDISGGKAWVNAIGSTAISGAYMADGRRDFYVSFNKNSWDLAAPYLLSKEAGCVATNLKGEDWHPGDLGLVVANKHLHSDLLKISQELLETNY